MATPKPPRVVLSGAERAGLERLVRAFTTGQQLALRARIVLLAGDGWNNLQIARELCVDDETPGHWRRRWLQFQDVPLEEVSVAERLADAPREDAPAKFTPEQVCQIIALACEKPADFGRPISQLQHVSTGADARGCWGTCDQHRRDDGRPSARAGRARSAAAAGQSGAARV